MPVQQVLPNIQDQSGEIWANAIQQLGQQAASAMQDYQKSQNQAGHNNRLFSQATGLINDIAKENNLSDDQKAAMLKKIIPDADPNGKGWSNSDSPAYEEKLKNVTTPLIIWNQMKKDSGLNIPMPNTDLDLQTNMQLLQSTAANAKETAANQKLLGTSALGQPAAPAPAAPAPAAPAQMGPPAPQTLQSLTTPQLPGNSVLTQTAGQDLTKPDTSNLDPSMAALVNGGVVAPPKVPPATNTIASTVSISPEIDNMISHIPTSEGQAEATAVGQQFKKGLISYTDFLKEYNATLKESVKTTAEINKTTQQQAADAAKQKIIEDAANARNQNTVSGSIRVAQIGANSRQAVAVGQSDVLTKAQELKQKFLDDPNSRAIIQLYATGHMSEQEVMAKFPGFGKSSGPARLAMTQAAIELNPPQFDASGNLTGGFNPKGFGLARGAETGATRHNAMLQDQKVTTANSAMVLINHVIDPKTEKISNMKAITPIFASELALNAARLVSPTGQVGIELQREFKQNTAKENISKSLAYFGLTSAGTTEANLRNIKAFIQREGALAQKTRDMYYSGNGAGVGFDSSELTGGTGAGPLQIGRFQVQVH